MSKAFDVPKTSPTLKLEFDFNRLCDVEAELGINAFDMTAAVFRDFRTLRAVFRIGLVQHNPVADDASAGRIIGEVGMKAATEVLGEALAAAVSGGK